jgi:hypothetical protein
MAAAAKAGLRRRERPAYRTSAHAPALRAREFCRQAFVVVEFGERGGPSGVDAVAGRETFPETIVEVLRQLVNDRQMS